MKQIVIAGGTGFLGRCIANYYHDKDVEIRIFSRQHHIDHDNVRYYKWDGRNQGYWNQALEGADVLINLNGKSVDCRYTQLNKQLIYDTRLDATYALGRAMLTCHKPPKVWINAASATIYRHSIDTEMDEDSTAIGDGFSVDVCKKWEHMFNSFNIPATRKVILRTGIVLGKEGGPLKPLKALAKAGLGGRHGSGTQYFSWIHEADFARIIDFLITHENAEGVYNVTSPRPIPNVEVMKTLRKALKMSVGIPLGKWVLELGAAIIGTETELILKSRRVIPKRLTDEGFKFQYNDLSSALKDLV